MLPTPHGPADAPLAEGEQDATEATEATPDATALLRVVEHLADVADDDAAEGEDGATPDVAPAPDEADDEADGGADDAPTTTAVPAAARDEVGPVAAALSDTRHTIDELTQPEQVFLAQQRALIAELCPDMGDAAAVGALFDRVREQWTQAQDRPDPRPLADAFGVALGDLVCAQVPDLHWATCRDRYGIEIVLARVDPEILVYPIAAVSQSWQTAAPGWFVTHLANVVRGVVPDVTAADA